MEEKDKLLILESLRVLKSQIAGFRPYDSKEFFAYRYFLEIIFKDERIETYDFGFGEENRTRRDNIVTILEKEFGDIEKS